MRFEILNVDHGFCAYGQGSDGRVLLFDCGHSDSIRPSQYLPARGISVVQRFFVMNYDEDHISDLLAVRRNLDVRILTRNSSLTSSQVRSLKTLPISPSMNELLRMIDTYNAGVNVWDLESAGFRVTFFHNNYPVFTDTNNLSLLVFLEVGKKVFALAGDLERAGWLELLKNPDVRTLLGYVNVFVASHHGRESGYCKEVFDYCSPSLIVMSDGPIQYDTQKMASTYGNNASGEYLVSGGTQEFRKVVTTRKDGNIFWDIQV